MVSGKGKVLLEKEKEKTQRRDERDGPDSRKTGQKAKVEALVLPGRRAVLPTWEERKNG